MSEEAYILEFCRKWLPAWTGNEPEKLLGFYAVNALYIDPANPEGIQGHDQLRTYFTKLLSANPNWVGSTRLWRTAVGCGYGRGVVNVSLLLLWTNPN